MECKTAQAIDSPETPTAETAPVVPDSVLKQIMDSAHFSHPKDVKCTNCAVHYCSIECQKTSWQEYHKILCSNPFLDAIGGSDKSAISEKNGSTFLCAHNI